MMRLWSSWKSVRNLTVFVPFGLGIINEGYPIYYPHSPAQLFDRSHNSLLMHLSWYTTQPRPRPFLYLEVHFFAVPLPQLSLKHTLLTLEQFTQGATLASRKV